MELWYRYAVLRVCPDPMRGEIVNVGLVIISPEGKIDTVIPENMHKAKALDTSLTAEMLEESAASLDTFASMADNAQSKEELINMACGGFIRCSEFAGFKLDKKSDYIKRKAQLIDLLVKPIAHAQEKQKKPRITTRVKNIFQSNNMLGESPDDLENHLVVPHYTIDERQGMKADFALKNGAMHITQTIDFNTTSLEKKRAEAALDALTLDKATDIYGNTTKRYVIYSAKSDKNSAVKQSLSLLGDHTDYLINLESNADITEYLGIIQKAIETSSTIQ